MACRMRRCTGFNPSRASGSARPSMTDMAYCMQDGVSANYYSEICDHICCCVAERVQIALLVHCVACTRS